MGPSKDSTPDVIVHEEFEMSELNCLSKWDKEKL